MSMGRLFANAMALSLSVASSISSLVSHGGLGLLYLDVTIGHILLTKFKILA